MTRRCCVYQIKNLTNGRVYVGSTINFAQRKWRHLYDLKRGKHRSRFMQRDFNKCGSNAFVIEIIEDVSEVDNLIAREQHWLDTLQPPYNSAKLAGTVLGVKHPPEVVQRNRERNAGFGNGNARLTEEQADEALSLVNDMTVQKIAEKYGVSRATVQRHMRRVGAKKVARIYGAEARQLLSKNAASNIAGRNAFSVFVLRRGDVSAVRTASVTEAAKILGICASAVAKRLKKAPISFYSDYCISRAQINAAMTAWPYRGVTNV